MKYNRQNPYYAYLKERYLLNKAGSSKKTYHIALKINSAEIEFEPGDSIGIIPLNEKHLIKKILDALGIYAPTESEINFLNRINICKGTKKLLEKIQHNLKDNTQISKIEQLVANRQNLNEYLNSNHVWEILKEYTAAITLEDLASTLKPMLPRFYSIASSNKVVIDEIQLLVAENTYYMKDALYYGVGSNYLCNITKINDPIALYVQKSPHFELPQDEKTPIIMIGPGTGVAPFRAFLQERNLKKASKNWLFFGERNKNYDFYYQDFLEKSHLNNQLKLDIAFSRDQNHKIYVQDLIKKKGSLFFEWVRSGAIIYICGDAKQMAKSVEKAILEVFETHGKMHDTEARSYLKDLRKNKRYLCDIY